MNVNRFKFESCNEKIGRLVIGRVLNVAVHKLKLHVFVFQKILVGNIIIIMDFDFFFHYLQYCMLF